MTNAIDRWEITNVCLPDEPKRKCVICIEGRKIREVYDKPQTEKLMNAGGLTACPGFIDTHVHAREPGDGTVLLAETWESLTEASLAGGKTFIGAMGNSLGLPLISAGSIEEMIKLVGVKSVGIGHWAIVTPANIPHIPSMASWDQLIGFKIVTCHTTGMEGITDRRIHARALQASADCGRPMAVHLENQELMFQNLKHIRETRQPLVSDHCRVRDTQVEVSAVVDFLKTHKVAGCPPVILCHISAPESIEAIDRARQAGQSNILVETCPQYFTPGIDCQLLEGPDAWRFKCNPALRTPEQVTRMEGYVCRPYLIDSVAADHAPHIKSGGADQHLDKVSSGMTGVQTSAQLTFRLVRNGRMSMTRFCDLMAGNVARFLGWKSKGRIAPGYDADIVLWDREAIREIRDEDILSACRWTPFHGMIVPGGVRTVIVGGQVRYQA